MKVKDGVGNGVWWEAPYVWKADGSDAVATLGGVDDALGSMHKVPTQIDCKNCHGDVSDVLIGVSAFQLSDPASPTTSAIAALASAGRLTNPVPADLDVPGTGVAQAALGYLHANCGHCHNDQAIKLNTQTKMRLRLLVGQTQDQTGAYATTVGTIMKHPLEGGVTDVLVKGDPDHSGLWLRMDRRDYYGMPPAGTQVVDEAGVDTVRQWITAF